MISDGQRLDTYFRSLLSADATGASGFVLEMFDEGTPVQEITSEVLCPAQVRVGELWQAGFFYLANRGILLPPGPDDQWTLSVQHTDAEIDRHVAVFREFAQEIAG